MRYTHDLAAAWPEVGGLGDHPDAGLRPGWSGDHAADVVGVDGDRDLVQIGRYESLIWGSPSVPQDSSATKVVEK